MRDVLSINWLQNLFPPRNGQLRSKCNYQGSIVLLVGGHSIHITPRVVAHTSSQKILIIRLTPYSPQISQPLELRVFSLFKILVQREQKAKGMKGETLKIYRAVLVFYKATRIPMVRSSFLRAGFRLNPDSLFAPVEVIPAVVLDRIVAPEILLEQFIVAESHEPPASRNN